MLITGWRVRIERRFSPPAMHLWRAGCQGSGMTSETSRMEPSSRPPRSCTSRRPENAAAPSASPRLTSLCFGVAHCGARRQTAAVSASGPGKQLDSPEERETELSMSWVSSAVTCKAKFRMHQQVALPWALAIFWEAFFRGFRDPAQCECRRQSNCNISCRNTIRSETYYVLIQLD